MKEITQLLNRKGQGLINKLEQSNMFARLKIEDGVSKEQEAVLKAKIETRLETIKEIRATFELEEPIEIVGKKVI